MLLVEDEDTVRSLCAKVLGDLGYKVLPARNGAGGETRGHVRKRTMKKKPLTDDEGEVRELTEKEICASVLRRKCFPLSWWQFFPKSARV